MKRRKDAPEQRKIKRGNRNNHYNCDINKKRLGRKIQTHENLTCAKTLKRKIRKTRKSVKKNVPVAIEN